jgi:hypothetical protein
MVEDVHCRCFALYGSEQQIEDPADQIESLVGLFLKCGLEPDLAGITYPRGPKAPFAYSKLKRHLSHASASSISNIDIYVSQPSYVQVSFGWNAYGLIEAQPMMLVCCLDSRHYDEGVATEIVKGLYELAQYTYGYTYNRNLFRGPSFYAAGAIAGKIDRDEEEELIQWSQFWYAKRFPPTVVRGLYDTNFLSPAHLELPVGGTTLGNWITTSQDRGALDALSPKLWRWKLSSLQVSVVESDPQFKELLVVARSVPGA